MTRFSKIEFTDADAQLLQDVQGCSGKWSTTLPPIINLRSRLLTLQKHRCVYCQAPLEAEEPSYRELEHILPKGMSYRCSQANGMSNDLEKRRSTLGYPEFQFNPSNLAVSCSQCNTQKGLHDALRNRSQARPLVGYPVAADLIWFHPQHDQYSKHITIDDEFGFTGKTEEGRAVISECGLDQAEILERKFYARAFSRAVHAASFRRRLETLADGVRSLYFSKAHAARALAEHSSIALQEARQLLERFLTADAALEMQAIFDDCAQYEDEPDD